MKRSLLLAFLTISLFTSSAYSQTVEVTGHVVISYREVDLTFSHSLKSHSGDNFENYSVHKTGFPADSIEIWGVWFGDDDSTVRIVLYEPMDAGQSYTVCIDGVVATDDTVILPGYEYSFNAIDLTVPEILSAGVLSPYELEIIFSEDLVEAGAESTNNYLLYQTGSPTLTLPVYYAKMRGIYDRVVLELEEPMVSGTAYTVELDGLYDMAGNALPVAASIGFIYDGENDRPRIGLYADFDHHVTATDGGGMYSFDMWVWVEPGAEGATAAIFGIDYPFGVSPEPPEYNPDLSWPTFDLHNGGMVIFGGCKTEWTWVCRQNIIVNVGDPGIISIFPFDDAYRQVAYLACDESMSIGRMEVCSNIEINSPDSRPVVLDAYFCGLRTINIEFNVPVTPETANEISNFEISEASDPGITVALSGAALQPDQVTVRLTTDEDLIDFMEYMVVINDVERVGGIAIRPNTEVGFTVLDVDAPTILSAGMAGQNLVDVTYSEPVEETSAISLINYLFFENGKIMSDVLHSAQLLDDGATVRLETQDPLEDGVEYILKISHVDDLRGNTIRYRSRTSFYADDVYPPTLKMIWSLPDNFIRLVFDEDLDEATASNPGNYRVGYNPLDVLSVSVDKNEVVLGMEPIPTDDFLYCSVYTKQIEDKRGNYNEDWVKYLYTFNYKVQDPLPQLGLFVDGTRTSGRVDVSPMGFFSVYLWCKPGPDGAIAMEYALRNISQEDFSYYIIGTENDADFSGSIGEPFSGIGSCLYGCKTDWFWMTRYDAILINGRGFIELVPTSYNVLPSVLLCTNYYPYSDVEIISRVSVNTEPESVMSTALHSSSVSFNGESIELVWEMSAIDDGVEFIVTRNAVAGESLALAPSGIERNGMQFRLVDSDIEKGIEYTYRVDYILKGETRLLFETETVSTPSMPLTLRQNKPNPFNPSTTISYYLPSRCEMKLEIFDVTGRSIAVLEKMIAEKGPHEVTWDGLDSGGNRVSSGIYFYRLRAGKEAVSRKMVLMR
ncbi:MAG: T9SS type A sorting domain-containing protein [Candidatus Krumholzibacteria bacterium]|nr:T9SS type A sorting domain-containing protein [Candidatus Krumholzibacteria bacterium]